MSPARLAAGPGHPAHVTAGPGRPGGCGARLILAAPTRLTDLSCHPLCSSQDHDLAGRGREGARAEGLEPSRAALETAMLTVTSRPYEVVQPKAGPTKKPPG